MVVFDAVADCNVVEILENGGRVTDEEGFVGVFAETADDGVGGF